MVHPQPARVARARRDQLGERPAWAASQPGCHGGQRPVLAALIELVRRRAHAHPRHDHVLPGPGVGAAGMRADREVGDHADAHALSPGRLLRRAELLRRQPLQPLVERDPVGQLPPELGDRGRAGVGQSRGPGPPVRPVHLGDGAPRGPVSDSPAVAGEERVQVSPAARGQRHRADQLGRGTFGGPDRVPVNQRRGAAGRPQRRGQRLHPGPVPGTQPLVFGNVLDPQVERADLAAAHRQIRRRADRRLRLGRVQRVDQHEVRAQVTTAPGGEVGRDRAGHRGPRRRASAPSTAAPRSPSPGVAGTAPPPRGRALPAP